MSNFTSRLKQSTPLLLAVLGSAGVILTAVTAAKQAPKVQELLKEAEEDKQDELTNVEKMQVAAKAYIPVIAVGMSTITCIVSSAALSKRQQVSLAGAYALASNTFKRYRNKVDYIYGEDADKEVLSEMEKDNEETVDADHYILAQGFGGGYCLDFEEKEAEKDYHLFYSSVGNRYFRSTVSKVLQAEYHLNRNLMLGGTVSLNDFYELLGISSIKDGKYDGDKLGWSISDELYWIDFRHSKTVLDDGLECYVIEIVDGPTSVFDDCVDSCNLFDDIEV